MFEVLRQSKALALSPALISFVLHISVGTYDDLLSWSLAKDANSQPLAGGLGEATGIAIRRNVMDFDAVVTFGGKGTLIQNSGGLCEVGTVGIQRGSNQQHGVD